MAVRNALMIAFFVTTLAVIIPKVSLTQFDILAFAFVLLASSLIYVIAFVQGGHHLDTYRLEGLGRYKNTIHLSYLLSWGILCLLAMGKGRDWWISVFKYAAILIFMVLIALTKTRGTFIALGGCIALFCLMGSRKQVCLLLGGILIAALAGFAIWNFSLSDIFQRGDGNRLGVWTDAWTGIQEKPILGHGIADDPRFFSESPYSDGWKSAHNVLLGHLYTGGIVGLLIYLGILVNMLWVSAKSCLLDWKQSGTISNLSKFSALTLLFVLLASLFNFNHYLVNVHIQWLVFWVPFAVIWHQEVKLSHANA